MIKINLNKEEFKALLPKVPRLLARLLYDNVDNLELLDGMKAIFDHNSRLYQHHHLSPENSILTQSPAAHEHLTEEERAWRASLKEGSELEAIKIDPELKCKCWARCIVTSVASKAKLRIKFPEESKTCDRDVDLWGPEIAPRGERSQEDDEFRKGLVVGSRVDCYDGTKFWYASSIRAREVRDFQGESLMHAQIAFRVPHPDGDKVDKEGTRYMGWEECYDEWMTERSARLAPYQKHTTEALENQTSAAQNGANAAAGASGEAKTHGVDDSLDHLVDQIEGQRIFAVQRKQCRSDLLIDFINTFGRLGGLDKMLERVSQAEGDANELTLLSLVVENVAKCSCVFHQTVVNEYFEKLEAAAMKKILGATNAQLRNTSKETTDEIVENIYKEILLRLASRDGTALYCDKQVAILEIGLLFLS